MTRAIKKATGAPRNPGGPSMATACIPQVTFEFYDKLKPVVARFDQAQASTDGGVVFVA